MVLPETRKLKNLTLTIILTLLMSACSPSEVTPDSMADQYPRIFPDYIGVTLPYNMVSPRFWIQDTAKIEDVQAVFTAADRQLVVNGEGRSIHTSKSQWDALWLASDTVSVRVLVKTHGQWTAYRPFDIYVSQDPIDKFLCFRLIEPGYESWSEMGIYQRCLENYRLDPIITNRQTGYGCMNCHSFCQQDPNKMLLHLRADYAGTYIIEDGEITKLNTKTPQTISALVYPSWHPSGDFVAFSVNDTKQMFHTSDPNRIEVYDNASDVVVYDVNKHEIVTAAHLSSPTAFETFPTFSPDGKTLYFCTADSAVMPDGYDRLKYNICSVSFDPATRSFGERVDTLYDAVADDHSASFPRVSPDGRFLMFTKSQYGTFSIWHRDADLYLADLTDGSIRALDELNTPETESYHSWSNNGRWVVFSSREHNGLYTRPYFAHVDADGCMSKPILMPPPTEGYYDRLMKSHNIPEFVSHPITVSGYSISQTAKNDPGIDVTFVSE